MRTWSRVLRGAALGAIAIAGLVSGCDGQLPTGTASPEPSPASTSTSTSAATAAPRSEAPGAFPWLPGLVARAVTTARSPEAVDQLGAWMDPDVPCSPADARAITADVAPGDGDEIVMASVGAGLVVFAGETVVASTPLADCGGSADGVLALAAGDAWIGRTVIAVVYKSGGRREDVTTLALFGLRDRRLEPLFARTIAEREGREERAGAAVLLPGAIILRTPGGRIEVHVFDSTGARYEERADAAPAARR